MELSSAHTSAKHVTDPFNYYWTKAG